MRAGPIPLLRALVLLAFAALSAALVKLEQEPPPAAKPSVRVALVIGNANYRKVGRLANPANDAADLSQALEKLNFKVFRAIDADHDEMGRQLDAFAKASAGADIALFFYAGHGIQLQGKNYAIPIDADLDQLEPDEYNMSRHMMAMDDVRRALDRASGLKILILDACRNNPLADRIAQAIPQSTRDLVPTRGLARIVTSGKGFVVAYATQPDQVAQDGGGRNSPFSAAIVRHIVTRDLEIGQVFKRVTRDVLQETQGKQTPEVTFSTYDDFYLNADKTVAPADPAVASAPQAGTPQAADPAGKSPPAGPETDRVIVTNAIPPSGKSDAGPAPETAGIPDPAPAAPAGPKPDVMISARLDPSLLEPMPKAAVDKLLGPPLSVVPTPDAEVLGKIASELVRLRCLDKSALGTDRVMGALRRYAKVASLPSAALDDATLRALQQDRDGFCPAPKPRPKAPAVAKEKPSVVVTRQEPVVVAPAPPAPAPEATRKRTPIHEGW